MAVTGEKAVVMVLDSVAAEAHPLQQPESLKHVLGEIASSAAPAALIELIRWLDSFHYEALVPPAELARLVVQLDEAAQPHLRQTASLYLSNVLGARSVRYKALGQDFHASLGRAYELVLASPEEELEPDQRLEMLLRSVRCANGEMKWAAFDYQELSEDSWRRAGEAYRTACEQDRLDSPVLVREGRETRSTIRREFVRLVAMKSACLDQLAPERIEATDKLVRHLQHALDLRQRPGRGQLFAVDLEALSPPRRCLVPPTEPSSTMRYFDPADAMPVLGELGQDAEGGGRGFDGMDDSTVAATIRHLIRHWGEQPPTRRFRRHPVGGTLSLATGLGFIRSLISGEALLRPAAAWALQDASRNGFGVRSTVMDPEVCRVGTLVAAHLGENGRWVLGVVRRVRVDEKGGASVGVQRLSDDPQPVIFDDGARSWNGILCDPPVRGRGVRIVCEPGTIRSGVLFVKLGTRMLKLQSGPALLAGPGYQVVGCQLA
ncbi:MAG: hypothetical protein JSS57_05585 [Proteobacteria bacterium]|nr:hypothetical protein [Pseudomonadota bacterium]